MKTKPIHHNPNTRPWTRTTAIWKIADNGKTRLSTSAASPMSLHSPSSFLPPLHKRTLSHHKSRTTQTERPHPLDVDSILRYEILFIRDIVPQNRHHRYRTRTNEPAVYGKCYMHHIKNQFIELKTSRIVSSA